MSLEDEYDLGWAFANIPPLADVGIEGFAVTALPGYTNRNYRLHGFEQDWVLRLPRRQTNDLIDRAAEAHNQALAHRLGLAPQAVWRNPEGVTLTPTLAQGRVLCTADIESRELLARIVESLQTLHHSSQPFRGGLDLRNTLEQHYALLTPAQRPRFAERIAQAGRILSLLDNDPLLPVPSHRDPVAGNLLFDRGRLWMIDWEYSAMASPYWDLAILCNDLDLDLGQSRRLLQTYCADGPAMQESALFDYRGLLKLLNDCWMTALACN